MKGLTRIPSQSDFDLAYSKLSSTRDVLVVDLVLYGQWSRFDPRLAEIWVGYLSKAWVRINPTEFNREILASAWSQVFGVLLESVYLWGEITEKGRFLNWKNGALYGLEPHKDFSQFFIGQRAFAGKLILEDACLTLEPYWNWGFFGREVLCNKGSSGGSTLINAELRRAALDELIQTRPWIRVADYRSALQGWVSLRQAELDLASHSRLRPEGNTKARIYRVRRRNG